MEITAQEHGHFLALYQMAIADGEFSKSEWIMLYKFAEERGVSSESLDQILLNPIVQIQIPVEIEKRIEYLYDLARMSWADGVISQDEINTLKKFAIKFEFIDENINDLVDFLILQAKSNISIGELLEKINN